MTDVLPLPAAAGVVSRAVRFVEDRYDEIGRGIAEGLVRAGRAAVGLWDLASDPDVSPRARTLGHETTLDLLRGRLGRDVEEALRLDRVEEGEELVRIVFDGRAGCVRVHAPRLVLRDVVLGGARIGRLQIEELHVRVEGERGGLPGMGEDPWRERLTVVVSARRIAATDLRLPTEAGTLRLDEALAEGLEARAENVSAAVDALDDPHQPVVMRVGASRVALRGGDLGEVAFDGLEATDLYGRLDQALAEVRIACAALRLRRGRSEEGTVGDGRIDGLRATLRSPVPGYPLRAPLGPRVALDAAAEALILADCATPWGTFGGVAVQAPHWTRGFEASCVEGRAPQARLVEVRTTLGEAASVLLGSATLRLLPDANRVELEAETAAIGDAASGAVEAEQVRMDGTTAWFQLDGRLVAGARAATARAAGIRILDRAASLAVATATAEDVELTSPGRARAARASLDAVGFDLLPRAMPDAADEEVRAGLARALGRCLRRAMVEVRVPVTTDRIAVGPVRLDARATTELAVHAEIRDGRLVTDRTRARFDHPPEGPLGTRVRGGFLTPDGRVRADIRGLPDLGVTGRVARPLGLPRRRVPLEAERLVAYVSRQLEQPTVDRGPSFGEPVLHATLGLGAGVVEVAGQRVALSERAGDLAVGGRLRSDLTGAAHRLRVANLVLSGASGAIGTGPALISEAHLRIGATDGRIRGTAARVQVDEAWIGSDGGSRPPRQDPSVRAR